jgi:sugar fermentation stimulation protein A
MDFPAPLIPGTLIRRYQRFLADVVLPDGTVVTAHCPNSGSMKGCAIPGSPVLLSRQDSPKRKLRFTWELVQIDGTWIGINTQHPNRLVREAIEAGHVRELRGYDAVRSEVTYGSERSRIDLLLTGDRGLCYLEVKNVTLREGDLALFPDAVTERGQKHLRELQQMVAQGHRGVIFFLVQRDDIEAMGPADAIDPVYGRLLREAVHNGVEALAYRAQVTPNGITVTTPLSVILPTAPYSPR